MKRKILVSLSCVLAVACALVLCHKQITAYGTRLFLTKTFGQSFSCGEITSSDGRISIERFSIRRDRVDMTMRQVAFTIDFKEVLTHPKTLYQLYRKRSTHWSTYLAAMKQYGVNLDGEQGVLNLDDKCYYFGFDSGEKKHEIGTLNVFLDQSGGAYPFLNAQFHMRGDQLISQLRVDEVESERFFHLGAFAFPKHLEGYTGAEGTVQMHGSVIFEKDGHIDEISTRFKSNDLSISIPNLQLNLGLKSMKGELNYPEGVENAGLPMWKRMDCNLTLSDGWVNLGQDFDLKGLNGTLGLDPREDPSLLLTGELTSNAKSLAMKLKGKGAVHEDHAYWLEFDLNLDDREGTRCDAFLSICKPERESHVIQLEASGLLPAQVEMLKGYFAKAMPKASDWTIHEGTFGGKLVALFEQGTLSHFEIQDMLCEKVSLVRGEMPFYFSKITGDGRLFEELNISFTMPTSHFFGLASEPLREIYEDYLPDDYVQLTSTLDFSSEGVKTSASVYFPLLQEAIHFGYTSPIAFPNSLKGIEKGWARSECVSHEIYGPLVRMGDEDLKIFGDVDLVGTYDGKTIELSLQVDRFLAKHPLIDFKADQIGEKQQTLGRIRFECVPETGAFSGTVPLRGASAYDRTLGLVAQDLDATLSFENGTFHGQVEDGTLAFDGNELLRHVQGAFQLDGEIVIKDAKGTLPYSTDREFILALDSWTPQGCTARLLDGSEEIAEIAATREENWSGKFRADLFGDPLDFVLSWDFLTNHCQLTATGERIQFSARKEGENYTIDEFKVDELSGSAHFSKGEAGFDLTEFTLEKGDLGLKAKGAFELDIPQKETPLALRSTLELHGTRKGENALQFSTTRPFQLAYTPMVGWMVAGVTLARGDSLVEIDQLEHLFSKTATAAHSTRFYLTQDLCRELIQFKLMPSIIGDFRLEEGLRGVAHFDAKGSQTHLVATLETPVGPLQTELQWDGNAGTVSLGEHEKLNFKLHFDEDRALHFDGISGKLGRIEANLNRTPKGALKGKLDLDFSLFHEIFDLPINRYLGIWKTGGGYRFDGIFTPASQLADWAFKGKIRGQDFECGGYSLRSMEAKVEIEPGQIAFENLDVTDDAGKAWVSEGAIMLSGEDWVFSFPLVEVRSFQPSFLRKHEGPEAEITPLVIKSASFENVRGRIDDPKSVSASGSLKFTNISKKGQAQLPKNLPTSVLRSMGLDGSLFVPASGQMEYIIQEGRCYLRGIENVISEKGRSEFSPPRNGVMGYVDFDGNVYIDMQIRQNVVRSISGPISMKIRGNFEDPEITIR